MKVEENWALFVCENNVEWSFGNPDKDFLQHTVNFLAGLSKIAEEALGENSVASIEFDRTMHSGLKASEIMVISLENRFFFVCSDPAITLKLINFSKELPSHIEEIINAVLVGQASILFANSISTVEDPNAINLIEKYFQNIILDINPSLHDKISMICSMSSTNFSMLSFNELLLFHYYIRKHKGLTEYVQPNAWVLISNLDGGELPFSWNVEKDVILSGYLAVIIGFIQTLFNGSRPKRLNFGTKEIRKLDFIYGSEYFLALDSSFSHLSQDPEFLEYFLSIETRVLDDLESQLKQYLIKEMIDLVKGTLLDLELNTLIESYSVFSNNRFPRVNRIRRMWEHLLKTPIMSTSDINEYNSRENQ
ncbi:MAG: hypothetical protein ACTSPV_03705 [Candidatus Hodarchaeales archaeon]